MEGTENADGKLTVILPNRNHAPFLNQAIRSVLNQTRPPDHLVVVDDCSTDNSKDVIAKFEGICHSIEIVHNIKRQGVIANINTWLTKTRTEFIAFQAADDFIEPPLYEAALDALKNAPDCSIAAPSCQWVDEAGHAMAQPADPPIADRPTYLSPSDVFSNLKTYGSFVSGNGSIYRTAHLRAVGFDKTLGPFCDGFAQHQLFASGGLCYIPERLAAWRKLDSGYAISSGRDPAVSAAMLKNLSKKLNMPEAAAIPSDYANLLLSRMRFDAVRSALNSGSQTHKTLEQLIPSALCRLVVSTVRSIAGYRTAVMVAMVVLRPGDVFFAVRRRTFKGTNT